MDAQSARHEIERIMRIADMTCTAHAGLRDQLSRRALILDLLVLVSSLWLTTIAFADPQIARSVTPYWIEPQLFIGILGVITFALSLFQLKTGWKERGDSHRRSADTYAAVKREARYALTSNEIEESTYRRVIDRSDMASVISVPIPERHFLAQKRRHLIKIAISRHLDNHSFASILFLRLRFWCKDNLGRDSDAKA